MIEKANLSKQEAEVPISKAKPAVKLVGSDYVETYARVKKKVEAMHHGLKHRLANVKIAARERGPARDELRDVENQIAAAKACLADVESLSPIFKGQKK